MLLAVYKGADKFIPVDVSYNELSISFVVPVLTGILGTVGICLRALTVG